MSKCNCGKADRELHRPGCAVFDAVLPRVRVDISTADDVGAPPSRDDLEYDARTSHLPTDAKARKAIPLYSGCIRYFPDALLAVAELSRIGNDQHNPGKPLHWDRSKSGDEHDALMRHLVEAGTIDVDGVRHSTKVAWRALAALQKEIEKERAE